MENQDKTKANELEQINLSTPNPAPKISSEDLELTLDPPQEDEQKGGKKKKKAKKKRSAFSRFFRFLLWFISFCVVLGGVGVYAIFKWASADLPSITKIADFHPPLTTTILARDGSLIDEIYNEKRYLITVSELPPHVYQAFISAEDKSFYQHAGINPVAILRAAIANFTAGSSAQGGSTITQQVVKRLLLTPERTYSRKIKEMLLAFQLEHQLSKDDILTIYLNQIHMGGMSYGIEAGARYYFAKHAADLTIAEAALLAGILPATTRYNPYRNYDMARARQVYVLGRMREDGKITDSQYEEAYYQKLEFKSMPESEVHVGSWYIEEVRRQLIELFSPENAKMYNIDYGIYGEQAVNELGLTVLTSMDPIIQGHAEQALRTGLENASKRHGWSGVLETVESSDFETYLAENQFEPKSLEKNNWVKALVVGVKKAGADVRLGEYQGFISVNTMGWARKPNKKASGDENSKNITDATKVLKVGDVVYVRFNPAKGKEDKKSETTEESRNSLLIGEITKETTIPLALEQKPRVQGALVSIEPQTSDVVAIVGGYSFGLEASHFNRATQAQRQPGSAFKPIVYSAALDQGFTLASQVLDAPIVFIDPWTKEVWRPSNFDPSFDGQMPLFIALARSRNLVTVRVAQQIGMPAIVQRARDLGLTGRMTLDIAASLGAIEVTPISVASAYSAFANQGLVSKPRFIQNIRGPWGNIIYENTPEHTSAISPQNAYLVSAMLEQVVISGTASSLRSLDIPLGGKTGTTNEEVDAWFIGVTPNLVTATYVGYDLPEPMGRGETGTRTALPIFKSFAENVLPLYDPDPFPVPEFIQFYDVNGKSIPFLAGTNPSTSVNALSNDMGTPSANEAEDIHKQLF